MVTAFIIESYKTLQAQPEDVTTQILFQISAQLASLTITGNHINSTVPSLTAPSFEIPKSSVLVNTSWILSLVFSLITASLGILLKQWFHEFMAFSTQDPKDRVKLRFYRDVGVQKWLVFELASFLPLLLQLALLLFFIGLATFLRNLNQILGWIVTGVMIGWLIIYLFTTFAPAFSAQCPYKTPIFKGPLSYFRSLRSKFLRRQYWEWTPEENEVCEGQSLDLHTLVCSRNLLQGEKLNEAFGDCLKDFDLDGLWQSIQKSMECDMKDLLPDIDQTVSNDLTYNVLYSSQLQDHSLFQSLSTTFVKKLPVIYLPTGYQPSWLAPMFQRLLQEGSNLALFAVLTLAGIQHRNLDLYPQVHQNPFPIFSFTFQKTSPGKFTLTLQPWCLY